MTTPFPTRRSSDLPVDMVPFDRRRTPPRAGRAEHASGEQHVEIRNLAARPHAADRPARWPRLARQARANRRRKTPRLLIAMRETRWHIGAHARRIGGGEIDLLRRGDEARARAVIVDRLDDPARGGDRKSTRLNSSH